jgi:hypothetical protein
MHRRILLIAAALTLSLPVAALAQLESPSELKKLDSPANDENGYAHQRNLRVEKKAEHVRNTNAPDDTNALDGAKLSHDGMGSTLGQHVTGVSR